MNPYLFVYGTLLRSAAGAPGENERRRLQSAARFVAAATLQGRLYDLGNYPGLTLSQDPAELVHGELLCLFDPGASFAWLDAYEGLTPQTLATAEYRRIEVPVKPQTGRERAAWVYVYNGHGQKARRIEDGCWRSGAGSAPSSK